MGLLRPIENLINWIVAPVQDPINEFMAEMRRQKSHTYIYYIKQSDKGKRKNNSSQNRI